MIDRKDLLRRHNPMLRDVVAESPLTVGNGEFAFTADITGLQSLYDEYRCFPLCTMSQWGWHTEPAGSKSGFYTLSDVEPTRYQANGREYAYAVECKPGGETAYHWLRHNPHRLNLTRIALVWDGKAISSGNISNIHQELDLYTGILTSTFELFGQTVEVRTVSAQSADTVGISVRSAALQSSLQVKIEFPYGSHEMSASNWNKPERHTTNFDGVSFERTLDADRYFAELCGDVNVSQADTHGFLLHGSGDELSFTAAFTQSRIIRRMTFDEAIHDSTNEWAAFWQRCGAVDFSRSKDARAEELERRTVLSQYQAAVNCSGSIPPQETGLACNSWYGKFHLEMHPLHAAWFPLWGCGERLERSFSWYECILQKARENAAQNGFPGARWPKMVGAEGIDSPSPIATLLIWQQPHTLYMLELVRLSKPEAERAAFMRRYWELVRETADFMCGFSQLNTKTGKYDLPPPLIPAQEEHVPDIVLNPAFELCYWRFGLGLACIWARELGQDGSAWADIRENLADPPIHGGLYAAHQNCPESFTKYNRDHPSMLYGLGYIPSDRIDPKIMSDTCDKVLSCWDFQTAWGWDFALISMTLARLGRPAAAINTLLMDTAKNSYAVNGHNIQRSRSDLPLYLPGNGSLLLALPVLLAGYANTGTGYFQSGDWDAVYEGISQLPY